MLVIPKDAFRERFALLASFDNHHSDHALQWEFRVPSIPAHWLMAQFKGDIMNIQHRAGMLALLILSQVSPGQLTAQSQQNSGAGMNQIESAAPSLHDFDFLVGHWKAHHRKLKQRLANNHEWIEFEGTLLNQPYEIRQCGRYPVLSVPDAPYRDGVALRSFDPKTQQWSIWWLDSRTPLGPLDPPMRGSFHNGVGTFYGDDTLNGKPVRARFLWSDITPTSGHWEQADSRARARPGGDKLGAGHRESSIVETPIGSEHSSTVEGIGPTRGKVLAPDCRPFR